jgi:hypothetical protein
MSKTIFLFTLLFLSSNLVANAQLSDSQVSNGINTANVPTVELCDLVRQASKYKGREVRVRALYHSWFEGSEFTNADGYYCDNTAGVWVEFDKSFEARTAPEVLKKIKGVSYRPEVDNSGRMGEYLDWQVEVLVTGFIYKPNKHDYGRKNSFSRIFDITSVEEIGSLKKYSFLTRKHVKP